MKELGRGILALVMAILVSCLVFTIGTLYSLGYSIWLSITFKKWYAFFQFWWRLVDGLCAAIGHALYQIAYALDLGWNVNGEILEDMFTAKEDTTFSQKNITVSATIGKLEIDGDLNKSGRIFSQILNVAFWQKSHAKDSWLFTQALKELRSKYFDKLVD